MSHIFIDAVCPECKGEGHIKEKQCPGCDGYGMIGSYAEIPDIEYNSPSPFAQALRLARESKKITISELATQLGIKPSELSDIEWGRIEPIGELRKQIAEWVDNERH